MTIRHPIDGEISYDTKEIPVWLNEHGLPASPSGQASARCNGGDGPRWFKLGKKVYSKESALREYLLSKLTPEVRSTSELKVARQLLIEDKSSGAPPSSGGE
jgi:hypothetical protein